MSSLKIAKNPSNNPFLYRVKDVHSSILDFKEPVHVGGGLCLWGVQVGTHGGAIVSVKKCNKVVNLITPHPREHISILSCINTVGGKIPKFYNAERKYIEPTTWEDANLGRSGVCNTTLDYKNFSFTAGLSIFWETYGKVMKFHGRISICTYLMDTHPMLQSK